jgi:hypothetical protein
MATGRMKTRRDRLWLFSDRESNEFSNMVAPV